MERPSPVRWGEGLSIGRELFGVRVSLRRRPQRRKVGQRDPRLSEPLIHINPPALRKSRNRSTTARTGSCQTGGTPQPYPNPQTTGGGRVDTPARSREMAPVGQRGRRRRIAVLNREREGVSPPVDGVPRDDLRRRAPPTGGCQAFLDDPPKLVGVLR